MFRSERWHRNVKRCRTMFCWSSSRRIRSHDHKATLVGYQDVFGSSLTLMSDQITGKTGSITRWRWEYWLHKVISMFNSGINENFWEKSALFELGIYYFSSLYIHWISRQQEEPQFKTTWKYQLDLKKQNSYTLDELGIMARLSAASSPFLLVWWHISHLLNLNVC